MDHKPESTWLDIYQTRTDQRDYPVKVAGSTLIDNKYSFAGCSTVFQNPIFGDFKEAREEEFCFPTKTLDDVLEVFACLFGIAERPRKEVSIGNFSLLWDMGKEYMVDVGFLDKCSHVSSNVKSISGFAPILRNFPRSALGWKWLKIHYRMFHQERRLW